MPAPIPCRMEHHGDDIRDLCARRWQVRFSPLCESLFVTRSGDVLAYGVRVLGQSMSYANGYRKVKFGGRRFYVHRLVASAYCDGFLPSKCVNHIDGDKLNNNCENLEWISQADNVRHTYATELMTSQSGSTNTMSKFSDVHIRKVFLMRSNGCLQKDIVSSLGMSQAYVSQLLSGKRRSVK